MSDRDERNATPPADERRDVPLRPLRSHGHLDDELRLAGKRMLRASMQRMRSATPATARRAASEAIRARVRSLGLYASGAMIALFFPLFRKGEVDVLGIDFDARRAGMRIVYPSLEEVASSDQDVDATSATFAERTPYEMVMRAVEVPSGLDEAATRTALSERFEERGHGFAEPATEAPIVDAAALDLVIVPGLAFDGERGRVGYGGGYYDALLASAARAVSVGVCFDFQIVAEVPRGERDRRVTRVVTSVRTIG